MSRFVAGALLLTLVAAVHGRSLLFDFVYEDHNDNSALVQDDTVRDLQDIPAKPLRSLTTLSYDLNRELFGIQPWSFHLGNVAFHAINVLLLFVLLTQIATLETALFLAAVFAVHPMMTEAVSYVSARADLVSTTGVLIALLAVSKESWAGILFGVVWAIAAKETAVVVLGLVPLWAGWTKKAFPTTNWLAGTLLAVLLVAFLTNLPSREDVHASPDALIATWGYLGRLVVPLGLSIEHDWIDARGWLKWALVISTSLTVASCWFWVHRPWWALGWLWTAIVFLPRYVVPLYEGIHERHLYLVGIGWCLGVGHALSKSHARELTPSWQ